MRIGHGYDVHAFGQGEGIILGGISIPFKRSLIAHSDGDVLTHALIDGILGALALGDIGHHFPDSSDKYLDCSSLDLLSDVAGMMTKEGYSLGNADLTIVAQGPKMAPHIPAMRQRLSSLLRCDIAQLNIKATTSEWLGFTGREEGIACHSSILLKPIEL
jgi:2-C-methyl-D-erythritol 2,4-cyclodiphosphate synthase